MTLFNLIPYKSYGETLYKFTAHSFGQVGVEIRFLSEKFGGPLYVVKWSGGWGVTDDMNAMNRYLLEETKINYNKCTNNLYSISSDARHFTSHATTTSRIAREL